MKEINMEFVKDLMVFISDNDIYEEIFWHSDLSFFVKCSDLFTWGTADAEDLDESTMGELKKAFDDIGMAGAPHMERPNESLEENQRAAKYVHGEEACFLYCARMRKMRPQGAYYKRISKWAWPLFDVCGPEREVDMFNPSKPGD